MVSVVEVAGQDEGAALAGVGERRVATDSIQAMTSARCMINAKPTPTE
jgi:hypothetical protein